MIKLSRDPALYLALFASVVSLLAAFVVHLTDTQQTLLNAGASAVVGFVVAWWRPLVRGSRVPPRRERSCPESVRP